MAINRNSQRLAAALSNLLDELGMASNIKRYEVIDRWPEITGSQVAAVSKALRIENKVLFVQVVNPAWRNELLYLKDNILRRISRDVGKGIINEIRFI